ncbi:hypothetical protein [Mariniblastus fucicola]|uniref:Uncharacterized protein n=1 Tax=Mariniblastus fucicola TaxID=980251 RepID=A0A5B9P4I3_9BACT|nr:hypothetical protein [Mariniblastus fucicola]QEG21497.1 hypothetical protein MFFC18_13530 [Mariniblastus fucicola]
MNWTQVKKQLQALEKPETMKLFKALFSLNHENRTVFENALGEIGSVSLKYYKDEIAASVNPSWNGSINLNRGRKAISQFKKAAPDDNLSRIDLMLFFVEQAAAQSLEYGSVNERFYNSMCKMLDSVMSLSKSMHPAKYQHITERLRLLDSKTSGQIGWGTCDYITDCLAELESRAEQIGLTDDRAE